MPTYFVRRADYRQRQMGIQRYIDTSARAAATMLPPRIADASSGLALSTRP